MPTPLELELAAAPAMVATLRAVATEVAEYARTYDTAAHGPWMPRKGGENIVVQQDGAAVAVVNTDYAAHLVEFGSKNNPPHAPLRRGALAAGLALVESPKP